MGFTLRRQTGRRNSGAKETRAQAKDGGQRQDGKNPNAGGFFSLCMDLMWPGKEPRF